MRLECGCINENTLNWYIVSASGCNRTATVTKGPSLVISLFLQPSSPPSQPFNYDIKMKREIIEACTAHLCAALHNFLAKRQHRPYSSQY